MLRDCFCQNEILIAARIRRGSCRLLFVAGRLPRRQHPGGDSSGIAHRPLAHCARHPAVYSSGAQAL